MIEAYTSYYLQQAQGLSYGGAYSGAGQKGSGLGSFLGGWLRRIIPLFKSGAKAVGKQALSSGFNMLRDVINGRPLKESVGDRMNEAGTALSKKAADKMQSMVGSGYKKRKKKKKAQSYCATKKRKVSRVQAAKKKKKQKANEQIDIFS